MRPPPPWTWLVVSWLVLLAAFVWLVWWLRPGWECHVWGGEWVEGSWCRPLR